MFKDYDKYLSASMKVYLFVLFFVFILKLMGLDYFGIDVTNPTMVKINEILTIYRLDFYFQLLCIYFNFYLVKSIILKNYKVDFETILIPSLINLGIYFMYKYEHLEFYQIYNISLLFGYFIFKKVKLKRIIKVFLINILLQIISSIVRNYNTTNYYIFINSLMNIDYYIMLIIWYKLEKQGGVKICQINGQEVYSYLQKKMNLKNLLNRKVHC